MQFIQVSVIGQGRGLEIVFGHAYIIKYFLSSNDKRSLTLYIYTIYIIIQIRILVIFIKYTIDITFKRRYMQL